MLKPDIIIDYMQADVDGFITVDTTDLPEGTKEHDHIVVGDHDAEPAVARVLEIGSDRTSIRVLPGAADDNSALLERRSPTLTA
jgi:NADPH-dependent ferric siderophore reductase